MARKAIDGTNRTHLDDCRRFAPARRIAAALSVVLAIGSAVGSAGEVELVNGLVLSGTVPEGVVCSAYNHGSLGPGKAQWCVRLTLADGSGLALYNQQVRRVRTAPDAPPILITPEDTPAEVFATPEEPPYRPGKPILPFGWRADGSGVYPDAEAPQDFRPLWRVKLRSWSHSSPVIAGDRIFVVDEPHRLVCFDRHRGTMLWQRHNPSHLNHDDLGMPRGDFVSSTFRLTCPTPVTDGRRIYAHFGHGVVVCYDLDGVLQWPRQVQYSTHKLRGGTASSPALLDGVLVTGGYRKDAMIGLDAATGDILWKYGKEHGFYQSYGGFQVVTLRGKRAVMNADGFIVDAAGTILCKQGKGTYGPTPAWQDGVAFLDDMGTKRFVAAQPLPDGSVRDLWSLPSMVGSRSPMVFGGILYLASGKMRAVDPADGNTLASSAKVIGAWSSPVIVGDHLVLVDSDKIQVLTTGREMRIERTIDTAFFTAQGCWGTGVLPIFDGNRWYYRDKDYLWCLASGPAPVDAASPALVAANLRGALAKNRDEPQPGLFRYVINNLPAADRTSFLMETAKSNSRMRGEAIRLAAKIRPAVAGLGDWMIERGKAGDGECIRYLGAAIGAEPAALQLVDMLGRPALVCDAAVALAHLRKNESQAATALVKHLSTVTGDAREVNRTLGAMDAFLGRGDPTLRQILVPSLIALLNHKKADPGMKKGAVERLGRLKKDAAPALNALRQAAGARDKALAAAATAAIKAIEAPPDGANVK